MPSLHRDAMRVALGTTDCDVVTIAEDADSAQAGVTVCTPDCCMSSARDREAHIVLPELCACEGRRRVAGAAGEREGRYLVVQGDARGTNRICLMAGDAIDCGAGELTLALFHVAFITRQGRVPTGEGKVGAAVSIDGKQGPLESGRRVARRAHEPKLLLMRVRVAAGAALGERSVEVAAMTACATSLLVAASQLKGGELVGESGRPPALRAVADVAAFTGRQRLLRGIRRRTEGIEGTLVVVLVTAAAGDGQRFVARRDLAIHADTPMA